MKQKIIGYIITAISFTTAYSQGIKYAEVLKDAEKQTNVLLHEPK
jgi:hypothetical protein